MSPFLRGYHVDAEESDPLFSISSPDGPVVFGMLWAIVWTSFIDVIPFLPVWLLVSFAMGVLLNLIWYYFLKARYGRPLKDPEIRGMVDRAREKIGMKDDVQIWVRESDKLICMATRNILFTSILLSKIAISDLLEDPENSEVIVAYKLARVRTVKPLKSLFKSGLFFFVGVLLEALVFLDFSSLLSIFDPFTFMVLILSGFAILVVILGVCFLTQQYNEKAFESVESLYGIPPIVALMRVFGKQTITEEKIEEYFEIAKPRIQEELKEEKSHRFRNAVLGATIVALIMIVILAYFGLFNSSRRIILSIFIVAFFGGVSFLIIIVGYTIADLRGGGEKSEDGGEGEERPYRGTLDSIIEDMMIRRAGMKGYYVRMIRSESGSNYIAVFNSAILTPANAILSVPPSLIDLLETPELLTPYIIHEIRYRGLVSKFQMYSPAAMFAAAPIIIYLFVTSLYSSTDFLTYFGYVLIWIFAVALIGWLLFRTKAFHLDLELARIFPSHVQMLQKLLDANYSTPYMGYPLKKRLEYLHRKGFRLDEGILE